jgi:hypothetical protein
MLTQTPEKCKQTDHLALPLPSRYESEKSREQALSKPEGRYVAAIAVALQACFIGDKAVTVNDVLERAFGAYRIPVNLNRDEVEDALEMFHSFAAASRGLYPDGRVDYQIYTPLIFGK